MIDLLGDAAISGGAAIGEALACSFLPYIRKKAGSLSFSGIDTDDLIQEGLIALFDAAAGYSEHGGASFKTYACACIDNRIVSACRKASKNGNLPLKDYTELEDAVLFSDEPGPEAQVIIKDEYEQTLRSVNERLTPLEKNVLALHLDGYGYQAIANALGTTAKSADNALQRARQKLKSLKAERLKSK